MKPTPQAIENAARSHAEARKHLTNSVVDLLPSDRAYAEAVLRSDLGDMVLVPKEPTDEMLIAGLAAGYEANGGYAEAARKISFDASASSRITAGDSRIYKAAYRAMIAAAEGE